MINVFIIIFFLDALLITSDEVSIVSLEIDNYLL